MKKNIFIFLAILIIYFFQTSFLPLFFPGASVPDAILVFIVTATIVFGFPAVWIWAITAGLIFDLFSFSRAGTNVIAFIVFCYFVSFFSRRFLLGEKIGGIIAGALIMSIITFLYNLWIFWTKAGFNLQNLWDLKIVFLGGVGWKLLFNLILFFIVLLLLKHLEKKINPPRKLIAVN